MSRTFVRTQDIDPEDLLQGVSSAIARLARTDPKLAKTLAAIDFEPIYRLVAKKALGALGAENGLVVTPGTRGLGCIRSRDFRHLSLEVEWISGKGLRFVKNQYRRDYLESPRDWKELERLKSKFLDAFRDAWLSEIFAIIGDNLEVHRNDEGELIVTFDMEVSDG